MSSPYEIRLIVRPRETGYRASWTSPQGQALVQYNFRDNCLNIISYLGLSTGSRGAGRAWVRLRSQPIDLK